MQYQCQRLDLRFGRPDKILKHSSCKPPKAKGNWLDEFLEMWNRADRCFKHPKSNYPFSERTARDAVQW